MRSATLLNEVNTSGILRTTTLVTLSDGKYYNVLNLTVMHPRDVTCVSGRIFLLFVNLILQRLIVATNLSPRVDTLIIFYLKTL
jgi:hypothetical protein